MNFLLSAALHALLNALKLSGVPLCLAFPFVIGVDFQRQPSASRKLLVSIIKN